MELCSAETDYRSSISKVLSGLLDKDIYNKWKKENHELYLELNNLVYEINQNGEGSPLFETLAHDLWAYDYISEKNTSFSRQIVEDQLKIINLCLRGQYLSQK